MVKENDVLNFAMHYRLWGQGVNSKCCLMTNNNNLYHKRKDEALALASQHRKCEFENLKSKHIFYRAPHAVRPSYFLKK